MRIILSRKGFDSSSGGCPSPIFPDGTMLALPIPDERSDISYGDIAFPCSAALARTLKMSVGTSINVGDLVQDLTRSKPGSGLNHNSGAHLDPDLIRAMYPRKRGWKPLLGQTGSAQGHLNKQGVQAGDVFVYFGLFRDVEWAESRWQFVKGAPAKHVIWGWMSVGSVRAVDGLKDNELMWARYHPHFAWQNDKNNTLYIAEKSLKIDSEMFDGAGVFSKIQSGLQLTRNDAPSPTHWSLPKWFYPFTDQEKTKQKAKEKTKAKSKEKIPLSYHHKPERWQLNKDVCHLQCVARGQEFVLDTEQYPESHQWLAQLITDHQ